MAFVDVTQRGEGGGSGHIDLKNEGGSVFV